jgi:hypothetical protein
MLRLDVNGGMPYSIPSDNPFLNDPNVRSEIWASDYGTHGDSVLIESRAISLLVMWDKSDMKKLIFSSRPARAKKTMDGGRWKDSIVSILQQIVWT